MGSQSTVTGGASARNGQSAAIAAWFAQSIRCVLTTPRGVPVEPEVNSTLATVSGPSRANASRIAGLGRVRESASIGSAPRSPPTSDGASATRARGAIPSAASASSAGP